MYFLLLRCQYIFLIHIDNTQVSIILLKLPRPAELRGDLKLQDKLQYVPANQPAGHLLGVRTCSYTKLSLYASLPVIITRLNRDPRKASQRNLQCNRGRV